MSDPIASGDLVEWVLYAADPPMIQPTFALIIQTTFADAAELTSFPVDELKRLMAAHSVSDLGCIEKVHLVDALNAHLESHPPYHGCLETIGQEAVVQCPVCMVDFKDADELRLTATIPSHPWASHPISSPLGFTMSLRNPLFAHTSRSLPTRPHTTCYSVMMPSP